MKISLEKFSKFLKLAMNENNHLRVGQSFWSFLYEEFPDIADQIIGTDCDTFYLDENLINFYSGYVDEKIYRNS